MACFSVGGDNFYTHLVNFNISWAIDRPELWGFLGKILVTFPITVILKEQIMGVIGQRFQIKPG